MCHIDALILFLIINLDQNHVIMSVVKQVFKNSSGILCVFPSVAMKCLALRRPPVTSNTFPLNCAANYLNKIEIDVELQQTYRSICIAKQVIISLLLPAVWMNEGLRWYGEHFTNFNLIHNTFTGKFPAVCVVHNVWSKHIAYKSTRRCDHKLIQCKRERMSVWVGLADTRSTGLRVDEFHSSRQLTQRFRMAKTVKLQFRFSLKLISVDRECRSRILFLALCLCVFFFG